MMNFSPYHDFLFVKFSSSLLCDILDKSKYLLLQLLFVHVALVLKVTPHPLSDLARECLSALFSVRPAPNLVHHLNHRLSGKILADSLVSEPMLFHNYRPDVLNDAVYL